MIRVRQIKIKFNNDNIEEIKRKVSKKLKIKESSIEGLEIKRKSIDARDKENIFFVYDILLKLSDEDYILKYNKSNDICKYDKLEYKLPVNGCEKLNYRPVIVGTGPCGLFSALILAEAGFRPIIYERGDEVQNRIKKVEDFWKNNILDENSNVCFGEGGAGTFSDGKLNTMNNDINGRIEKVFKTFVSLGAPKEILYEQHPHIGTDLLVEVLINLRKKIISLGGEFHFNSLVTDIRVKDGKVKSIIINNCEEVKCDILILAIGHSAVDTIEVLLGKKVEIVPKKFAIGVRIQHPQLMINQSQYGKYYNMFPPANYKLTYRAQNKRGVYSFCMCPGGYVVNSSTEKDHLVINGMSYYKRDSGVANSAIIVEVNSEDFGSNPLDGIKYQRKLEALAFQKGEGKIPVQLLKDYLDNKESIDFLSFKPKIKGEYQFSNLNDIFPYYINDSLKEALVFFDKKIKGFAREDAILAGVETRTSSAVRIVRDSFYESNIKGIYPAGEGSGYSGGITTSAVDGIKVSEEIIKKYSKL